MQPSDRDDGPEFRPDRAALARLLTFPAVRTSAFARAAGVHEKTAYRWLRKLERQHPTLLHRRGPAPSPWLIRTATLYTAMPELFDQLDPRARDNVDPDAADRIQQLEDRVDCAEEKIGLILAKLRQGRTGATVT